MSPPRAASASRSVRASPVSVATTRPSLTRRQRAPRIRRCDLAEAPARDHVVEEDEHRATEPERRERDEEVEAGEVRRVVGDAPAHSLGADDVHREEREVEADERQPEVELPEP